MPFVRPTISQLLDRIRDDIDGRFPGADSRLRRSVLEVLGRVHAGALHGAYGYLDFIARQVIPDTMEGEYLVRWASIWSLSRQAAVPAHGSADVTGSAGAVIAEGAILQRADGVEYAVTEEVTIGASLSATAPIQAVVPGVAGNASSSVRLAFVSPIAGISSNALVSEGGISSGAEEESDALLRTRLLQRIQEVPEGGATGDYERWALAVPGVTRVWVYPNWLGPGSVGVSFAMDGKAGSPVPTEGEVEDVATYIEQLRPVTADVVVFAPTNLPIDFTLSISPDTSAVRAAVAAELADLIRRDGEPGGVILLSRIREAISTAAGESDNTVVFPEGNIDLDAGELPSMGAITWL